MITVCSLLEEVKYGAKFNKQIEVKTLERENHSLVEELAGMNSCVLDIFE